MKRKGKAKSTAKTHFEQVSVKTLKGGKVSVSKKAAPGSVHR